MSSPTPIVSRARGRKVHRRYAIVDQAMIREAAVSMNPRREGSANYCTMNCTIGEAPDGS